MMMKTTSQHSKALSERKRKRLKRQIEKSLSSLRSNRKNYRTHIELGDSYSLLDQAQKADEHYSRAIEILHKKPVDERARKQIIMLYGKILSLVPEKREAYTALGHEYVAAGQKEKAARFLLSSAKRAFEDGDYELALQCYTDVVDIGKSNPYIIERCTEIFLKLGRKDDAVKNYIHIGDTYAHDEKYIEALDYYKKADALQTESPELTLKIARMYYALEWSENAATELVKLAEYHEEHQNYQEAMKYYQHSLSLDQDNEKALTGKQRITELHTIESPWNTGDAGQDPRQKDILDELDQLEEILREQSTQEVKGQLSQKPVASSSIQRGEPVNGSYAGLQQEQTPLCIIGEASELSSDTANGHDTALHRNGYEVLQPTEQAQQPSPKAIEVSWQDRLMDLNLEKDFVLETGLEEEHVEATAGEEDYSDYEVVDFNVGTSIDTDLVGEKTTLENLDIEPETDLVGEKTTLKNLDIEPEREERASSGEASGDTPLDAEAEQLIEQFVIAAEEGASELEPSFADNRAASEPQQPVLASENSPFEPEQIMIEEFSELEQEADSLPEEEFLVDPISFDVEDISERETLTAIHGEVPDMKPQTMMDGEEMLKIVQQTGATSLEIETSPAVESLTPMAKPSASGATSLETETSPEIETSPAEQSSLKARENLSQEKVPEMTKKLGDLAKQLENTEEEKYFLQEQFTAQIRELRSREAAMRREFELAKKEKEEIKLRLDEITATYEVSRHHAEKFDETRYEAIVSKIQHKKLALQQYLNRLIERREENGRFMAVELQHLGETKQRLQHNLEYIQQVKTRIEEKINTELREAQQQIRALTLASQKLEDHVSAQERAESNLRKQLATVKEERDTLQDQFTETITALTADNEKLGEQVKELSVKHSDAEETLKRKFQTLHVSYQRLKSEYRSSLDSKERELNRTAQRLSEFADEYVKLEKTLGEIRQERNKLGKMLAKETATRERLEEKLINIESQVDSLEVQGTELLEQLGEELDRQLSLKHSTSDEFQTSLEDFERLLSLQEREIQSLEVL